MMKLCLHTGHKERWLLFTGEAVTMGQRMATEGTLHGLVA